MVHCELNRLVVLNKLLYNADLGRDQAKNSFFCLRGTKKGIVLIFENLNRKSGRLFLFANFKSFVS